MNTIPVPVNEPLLNGNEKLYLNRCIDEGWISSEGPFIKEFEEKFAQRVGRKYGIAVSNGSVAIDLAIAALRIGEGDEVIMPTFTIISCAAAVVRAGAVPVLVDSYPDTWNVNVEQIEKKITKKTKAIMVVHIYGLPVDMDPVFTIAKKYGLKIIEDAAEMHGQKYRGKPCGSFGEISTFSFYPNKHITTGEGGMVVTDDLSLAERCRSLRNLCFIPERRFYHEEMGWNFRMTNMQAALGLAQLERLDEFVLRKRSMGAMYQKLLKDFDCIQLPIAETDYAENIYWVFGFVLKKDFPLNAREMMEKLAGEKIGSRPFFFPMHEQPVFHKMGLFIDEKYPQSDFIAEKGLYFPSGLALKPEQIEIVVDVFRKIVESVS